YMPQNRKRILADEKMLVLFKTIHIVARPNPGKPFIGLDKDHHRIELSARDRIPGGVKRGFKGFAQMLDANFRDFHSNIRWPSVTWCGGPCLPCWMDVQPLLKKGLAGLLRALSTSSIFGNRRAPFARASYVPVALLSKTNCSSFAAQSTHTAA